MSLIVFKTFDNPIDAYLLKTKLKSEGIRSYLFDENIISINPLYNLTLGGIKLMINNSDLEKSNAILEEIEQFSLIGNKKNGCPKCQSNLFYNRFISMKGIKGYLSIIVSLIFFVFPIYYKIVYRCKSCGYEFNHLLYDK